MDFTTITTYATPDALLAVAAATTALTGVATVATFRLRSKLREMLASRTAASVEAAEAKALALQHGAELENLKIRFGEVINADFELDRIRSTINFETVTLDKLRGEYREKRATYDELVKQASIFNDQLAFAEMGIYEPSFSFGDSEAYRCEIEKVRAEQKAMISDKRAVICTTEWTTNGSRREGQTMVNRGIRLTLRAFNGECDAAISKVKWNNANAMTARIQKAFDQINTVNETMNIYVQRPYLDLKLRELKLVHEYQEKRKIEREESLEASRAAREEAKLVRDLEKAQDEEARYQRLLDKAKTEAERLVGPQLGAFREQIAMLEKNLAEAHTAVERAQAMAEKTRTGWVYIISNIGSFGENVVKIGLTRRLDPTDRVRELGDASVPFLFDTHAMIYSDDAPALERALHAEFELSEFNAQNYRKEFFRISIDEVEQALKRLAPNAPFYKDVEAQEYRETKSRREVALTLPSAFTFPAEL